MDRVIALALALASMALAATGCRKSMAPVCRQICTCSPCTGADLDACVEKVEAAQENAEDQGCARQFDDVVGCFETTASCGDGAAASTERCTRVEDAFRVCADAGSPFSTVCEQATRKLSGCAGSPMKTISDCAPRDACLAQCTLMVDCDVILGKKPDSSFNDCTSACFGAIEPPSP